MTERRVLVAAMVSSIFLAFYAQLISSKHQNDQRITQHKVTEQVVSISSDKNSEPRILSEEESVLLESDSLAVTVGIETGAIREVVLKRFKNSENSNGLNFTSKSPIFQAFLGRVNEKQSRWSVVARTKSTVQLESRSSVGTRRNLSFLLEENLPVIKFKLTEEIDRQDSHPPSANLYASWTKVDKLDARSNQLETFAVFGKSGEKLKYGHYYPKSNSEKYVPRGTNLFSLSERYFCQAILINSRSVDLKILPSIHDTIAVSGTGATVIDSGKWTYDGRIYLGPRDYFYLKASGFEQTFPIGIIGKIGLVLLLGLSLIAGATKNYGVAIIVFAGIVTCVTAPFTVLSFRSMKKMQELKPEMDKIMAKHKDDPTRANREVFALYKTHKVSPISGCLPMVLQMPIFIALFQAISHYVELRGKSFLWISDLSLPDHAAQLPMALPILGSDLNLLPIIMAVAMYLQSAISQKTISARPTQTPNIMSGPLMAVIFGVMFYHFPSGLVLYWLTNSVMSMLWYKVAK